MAKLLNDSGGLLNLVAMSDTWQLVPMFEAQVAWISDCGSSITSKLNLGLPTTTLAEPANHLILSEVIGRD